MKKTVLIVLSLLCIISSCKGGKRAPATYSNPLIERNCADPSVIDDRANSGWFYAYSTQTRIGRQRITLPVYRSKDMVEWEFVGDGFNADEAPAWSPGGTLWAPDVNYIDGHYVLYYAMGHWGDGIKSASGVAVSDNPTGPFKDLGMIVSYANTGVLNSIDPVFFEDNGQRYLFWGSFGRGSGIWGIELASDGLSIKDGAKAIQVGAIDTEGTYIRKKDGWYYLFASRGSCCNGAESTYHIVVARSNNIFGPYISPDGACLLDHDYNYTILSGSPDRTFVGTGHDAAIITDDKGQDWMCYHAYRAADEYSRRCLMMDKVLWAGGWPYFKNGQPSKTSDRPVWKKKK